MLVTIADSTVGAAATIIAKPKLKAKRGTELMDQVATVFVAITVNFIIATAIVTEDTEGAVIIITCFRGSGESQLPESSLEG